MFYPKNFPRELEPVLIKLLLALQNKFGQRSCRHKGSFRQALYSLLAQKSFSSQLQNRFPPYWWFNFILLRHSQLFSPFFRRQISQMIVKTKIRSLSGVVPVAVFTRQKGCPFHCLFCPNQPSLPKSYLADEPAVMRAKRNRFDPFAQTKNRLLALALSGHPLDKTEIIIKGGSFSSYSSSYRQNFVKGIFDAANLEIKQLIEKGKVAVKKSKNLSDSQKINERASCRIVGINIETRPDLISLREIKFLRRLGVTQVEIGVQILDDQVLSLVRRGHLTKEIQQATFLLKEAGFKVGYHLMPNLPGSNPQKDLRSFQKTFTADFSPDYLKIYPTVITRYTQLAKWFKRGKYHPYSLSELIELLVSVKTQIVPRWVRISRLARDISRQMMVGPPVPSHLREVIQQEIKKQKLSCSCLRCREIKSLRMPTTRKLKITSYPASGGKEYFLEFVDKQDHCLGFLRLRIPAYLKKKGEKPPFAALAEAVLVRELRVYGSALPLKHHPAGKIQHQGLGKQLLQKAEKIARREGVTKLAVIAAVGTRDYYRRFGYQLADTYMVKKLC